MINRTLLARFLPVTQREILKKAIMDVFPDHSPSNLSQNTTDNNSDNNNANKITIENGILRIGDVSSPISTSVKNDTSNSLLIPDHIIFYEMPQHIKILQDLLKDININCQKENDKEKEHILLIGNQGVGKNKLGKNPSTCS